MKRILYLTAAVLSTGLAAWSGSASAQACPGATYEAETMTHTTGGATPDGWNIWSAGYIATTHAFHPGVATITVTARGEPADHIWPRMSVTVNGVLAGTATVTSATWSTYKVALQAPVGTGEIRVSFDNDFLTDTEDRNLLIDKLVVGCGTKANGTGAVPSNPIAFTANQRFRVDNGTPYFIVVPSSYDSTHHTPTTLFVWSHGCGGTSISDVNVVSPGDASQHWISVALDGAEGGCWNVDTDVDKLVVAIRDVKTHFNIAEKGVILGGYSSGGDLSYRAAFEHADDFAGIVVTNTSPFRDVGSTKEKLLGHMGWKLNIVHLAHLQDDNYKIDPVRAERAEVIDAGFPLISIDVPGTHWDNADTMIGGRTLPKTNADIVSYLLPYLSAGWSAP